MSEGIDSSLRQEVLQHFASGRPLPVEHSLELLSRLAWEVQSDERIRAQIFPAWFLLEEVPDCIMKFLFAPSGALVFDYEDFLPPEFLRKGGIDERSCVFALGVTGFKLITGNGAVYARPSSTRRSVQGWMEGIIRPISDLQPDCPPAVASVIEKALKRSPEERQQTVNELLMGIHGLMNGRL